VGLAAGTVVVTPVIAWMYFQAQDGPIFPAPLVALVVAASVSFVLFIFQGMLIVYEWINRQWLGKSLLWVGVLSGLIAGLIPYALVVAPYRPTSDPVGQIAFAGLGIFQGLIVFGCHWFANRSKFWII
jgi:hypothetical protein